MSTGMSGRHSFQAEELQCKCTRAGECLCSRKSEEEAGVAGGAKNSDEVSCVPRSCENIRLTFL